MTYLNVGFLALGNLKNVAFCGIASHLWTKTALTPALVNAATYVAFTKISGQLINPKQDKSSAHNYAKSMTLNLRVVSSHLIGALAATFITPKITQKFFNTAISLNQSFHLAKVGFLANYIPAACIASTSLMLDKK